MTESTIYTIGHSTHPVESFVQLLKQHGVRCLVDVRSQPYGRWTPHFNRELLAAALRADGLEYISMGESLGGRPQDSSLYDPGSERPNYSRQRQTTTYQQGLSQLDSQARQEPTAIMCSEGDPDTCHRTLLITPSLIDAGLTVQHILPDGSLRQGEKPMDQLGLFDF